MCQCWHNRSYQCRSAEYTCDDILAHDLDLSLVAAIDRASTKLCTSCQSLKLDRIIRRCRRSIDGNGVSLMAASLRSVTKRLLNLARRGSIRQCKLQTRGRRRMDTSPHILVVDDDRDIRELLSKFLRKNGFRVDVAANGRAMRDVLATSKIDLVVLDRVMPGEDCLTLCRDLRRESRVPVILLTLLGADTDRIVGLEVGADDYVVKPFNPQELLARMRAVLRRANDLPFQNDLQRVSALQFNGWVLDQTKRELLNPDGVLIDLSQGELDLLVAFAEHPQVVLSREQLLNLTRSRNIVAFDRSIDMQVTRLRRKIEADPENPEFVKTIRNKGYIFTPVVSGVIR